MTDVHSAALSGFSSGVSSYQRGRPGYPGELLNWLIDDLALCPGKVAVDLGAGTGKFTTLLIRTGAKVIAIEPVDAMRNRLAENLPQVLAFAGTAQHMPLDDGSVDAIICAQSFHWFASRETLQEFNRVLAPDGRLGLIWNIRSESCEWGAALTQILSPYEADIPRFRSGEWRQALTADLFSPLRETVFTHAHAGTPQEIIVDRALSVSFIAALPAAEKAQVVTSLNTLIETHAKLKARAQISAAYETHAYWARVQRQQPAQAPQ